MTTLKELEQSTQTILLVEDNPEDRETTIRAFKKSGISNPIHECEDGDETLDYLFRRGKYELPENSPRPGIILLDLNMPGTDGFEVLAQIKTDSKLRRIPIIVLTTSSDSRDIDKCYAAGANSYVQKPVNLASFIKAIERLKEYWLEISILPIVNDDH